MPRFSLRTFVLLAGWLVAAGLLCAEPPRTAKKAVSDEYHGVKVLDEYRWLEDAGDPDVRRWMLDQNRHSRGVLDRLPSRGAIAARLKQLHKTEGYHYSKLTYHQGKIYAQSGGAVVVIKDLADTDSELLVVDPEDVTGSKTADIDFYVLSPDGKKVAVSISLDGKQDGTVYVFETATGKQLPDEIPHVCSALGGSLAWKGDSTGFYYTRNADGTRRPVHKPGGQEQVWFHTLGKPLKEDTYVLGKDFSPLAGVVLETSPDGKYLLASVNTGWTSETAIHHLLTPAGDWVTLNKPRDRIHSAGFGQDNNLWLLSCKDSPRGALLRLEPANPDLKKAELIVPAGEGVLQGLTVTKTKLFVVDRLDGGARLRIFDHQGKEEKLVPLPPLSHVEELVALDGDQVLFHRETYLTPPAWSIYDAATGKRTPTFLSVKYPNVNFSDAEVVREMVPSKDGVKVPLTLIRRKDTKRDGNNPVLLEGYGGYGHNMTPEFSASRRLWLEQGGVWAVAHLRGDGEFGEEWHCCALGTQKQKSFDDFLACAKWLVEQKYTRPERLAIEGGSNGGTLVGVALVQQPQLFAAVAAHSGNYDCLRQELHPAGCFDIPEFGTVKVKEEFEALYGYSPYHRVKDGVKYPAVLIVCGENDPRVDPADSRKFAARLQAATASERPVLLYTRLNSGHSCLSFDEEMSIQADKFAFFFDQLGVKYAR
jgi:prolyl oligopeptidase